MKIEIKYYKIKGRLIPLIRNFEGTIEEFEKLKMSLDYVWKKE